MEKEFILEIPISIKFPPTLGPKDVEHFFKMLTDRMQDKFYQDEVSKVVLRAKDDMFQSIQIMVEIFKDKSIDNTNIDM
jgi:hypothetical protein